MFGKWFPMANEKLKEVGTTLENEITKKKKATRNENTSVAEPSEEDYDTVEASADEDHSETGNEIEPVSQPVAVIGAKFNKPEQLNTNGNKNSTNESPKKSSTSPTKKEVEVVHLKNE